jgi:hypothetical protein
MVRVSDKALGFFWPALTAVLIISLGPFGDALSTLLDRTTHHRSRAGAAVS